MPRKKTEDWLPDDRGRYRRKVGWWVDDKGERKQYPFFFGTDKAQACGRLLRVQELWSWVVKRHLEPPQTVGLPLAVPEDVFDRGDLRWTIESLWIARELAMGNVQITVERGSSDACIYAHHLQRLARNYPFVFFVPDDQEAQARGAASIREAAEYQLSQIQQMCPNILPEATQSLHEALDGYSAHIKKSDVEPTPNGPVLKIYGVLKIEQAHRLKQRHANRPLSTLDYEGCQELLDYWRNRPLTMPKGSKPPKPMTKKTCENHVSELMRFFRWLHKSKEFGWRKPEDFDELRTDVKEIQEERTSIAFMQVRVYEPDQLALLNKYATPLERLLLLLGLNCGFKGAEQGTLLLAHHLFLDQPHPNAHYLKVVAQFECRPEERFILYSRNKTKVYGEFLLWPQTVEMLRWAVQRQQRICSKVGIQQPMLLITEKGQPFFRLTEGAKNQSQIFGNKWDGLIKRIRKDHKNFPNYSFSSLRDVASTLIRHSAGGEVAEVFLMHGTSVRTDNLLDLYTNRPFNKVFEALRALNEQLKPMFDAAPQNLCEQPMQQYTSLGKRERILELYKQGKKVSEIMAEVGVSQMTVLRLLERMCFSRKKRKEA